MFNQQGWVCPKCGYVYSPNTPVCYNCNRPEHEKTITTTEATLPHCTCGSAAVVRPGGYCINCRKIKL